MSVGGFAPQRGFSQVEPVPLVTESSGEAPEGEAFCPQTSSVSILQHQKQCPSPCIILASKGP